MNTKPKAQASRPEHLFLFNDLVGSVGLVKAAILSDIYYWLAQGKEPWRTYENWSSWLCVNRKTIARNVDQLVSIETISRKRTRLFNGGLGAYQFSLTKHENSKYVLGLHKGFFANEYSSNDLGSMEKGKVSKPKFQMVQVDSIEKLGDLTLAYIVNGLAWTAASLEAEAVNYYSISFLAKRLNLERKTLKRNLDSLEERGLLNMKFNGRQVSIELFNEANEVQENHYGWSEGVREKRIEGFDGCL